MILTLLVTILAGMIAVIFNVLPTGTLSPTINTGIQYLLTQIAGWNNVIPVNTLFQVIGLAFAFHAGIFAFRLFNWTLNRIWGHG